jgi:flagellar basal body-associated protein FliL
MERKADRKGPLWVIVRVLLVVVGAAVVVATTFRFLLSSGSSSPSAAGRTAESALPLDSMMSS